MKSKYKTEDIQKKILIVIAIIAVAIVPLCFLYSLILLIIHPTDMVVVEERKNI